MIDGTMQKKRNGFRKFRRVKPRAVGLPHGDLVTMGAASSGGKLPLVIQPVVDDVSLSEWACAHLDLLEEKLLHHGAVLFRGFNIDNTDRFERTVQAITPDLVDDNGELPRSTVSKNIYEVSYAPPEETIRWHSENSFCPSWPMKLWFCCVLPSLEGGETPIVDNREVARRLDPEVRDAFREKGIMYLRNFGRGLDFDWPTAFQTDEKTEVESRLRAAGIGFEWKEDGGLKTRAVRPAILNHPRTGEEVFFCQPALWHVQCNPESVRDAKRSFFSEEDLPRHCYYGDGSPIPDKVIDRVMEIYREIEVATPWQKGEMILLDNMLTAHARNPFVGPRQIFVAMAEPISEKDH